MASVAALRGTLVEALLEPLYGGVDSDALETLVTGGDGHVRFEYAATAVTVDHRGGVSVEPLERE